MWNCKNCNESNEDSFEVCWNCGTAIDGTENPSFIKDNAPLPNAETLPDGVMLTTTPSIEDQRVSQYLGVVCGEAILGANVFSDFKAGITDIVGGRSTTYESKLAVARRIAIAQMAHDAKTKGANAVLSISVDYETVGNSMLMVTCSGTAVKIQPVR